jgi:hypothetical protein
LYCSVQTSGRRFFSGETGMEEASWATADGNVGIAARLAATMAAANVKIWRIVDPFQTHCKTRPRRWICIS